MGRLCEIVPTTPAHCAHVAAHTRQEDVAELLAGSGMTPAQVLDYGLRVSAMVYTGLVDGVPVCVFGVSPASALTGKGCPWMVATPGLEPVARRFALASRGVLEEMLAVFPVLINFVDNRNVKAIRWLGWLGFWVDEPKPHGREGRLFRMFVRCSNV